LVEALDYVGDASGLNVVSAGSKLVVHVLEFSIEHLNFIVDFALLLGIAMEMLDFSKVFPVVETGNHGAKGIILRCRTVDEVVEPRREWLNGQPQSRRRGMHRC
jgi:hypothetical protein